MAYQFATHEGTAATVARVYRQLLRDCMEELEREVVDRQEAIHDARKNLKKIRSLLRLSRTGVGEVEYNHRNDCCRDLANSLSDVRDADALLECLQRLQTHYKTPKNTSSFNNLHQLLVNNQAEAVKKASGEQSVNAVPAAISIINTELSQPLPLITTDGLVLVAGLTKSYRKGRTLYKHCRKEPSAEAMHDWRKRVKDLCYQVDFMQPLAKNLLEPFKSPAKSLADLLGDYHDLSELNLWLVNSASLQENDKKTIVRIINKEQKSMHKLSKTIGKKLYALKVAEFYECLEGEYKSSVEL